MKRSALHLGVDKHGLVKWVKVTAFRDTSYSLAWQQCQIQGIDAMQSFECYIPTRQTKPFKKLLDKKYNQELALAVINEVRGQ